MNEFERLVMRMDPNDQKRNDKKEIRVLRRALRVHLGWIEGIVQLVLAYKPPWFLEPTRCSPSERIDGSRCDLLLQSHFDHEWPTTLSCCPSKSNLHFLSRFGRDADVHFVQHFLRFWSTITDLRQVALFVAIVTRYGHCSQRLLFTSLMWVAIFPSYQDFREVAKYSIEQELVIDADHLFLELIQDNCYEEECDCTLPALFLLPFWVCCKDTEWRNHYQQGVLNRLNMTEHERVLWFLSDETCFTPTEPVFDMLVRTDADGSLWVRRNLIIDVLQEAFAFIEFV